MVMVMNVTFAMTESSNLITQKLSSVVAVAQQVIWELEGWHFDSWLLHSMYQSVLKQDTELSCSFITLKFVWHVSIWQLKQTLIFLAKRCPSKYV